jgi:3D (Asp-Asp-Asp) domain-containing protein
MILFTRLPRLSATALSLSLLALALSPSALQQSARASSTTTHEVTATAYTSLAAQGQGDPTLTAWGVQLEPGMRVIAVSRDLIEEGLRHGVKVRIEGLPGTYTVADKMHRRWSKKIDIYMGTDVTAAHEWGKREVTLEVLGTEGQPSSGG